MNPCYYCEDMVNGKCCMTVKDEKIDAQSALIRELVGALEAVLAANNQEAKAAMAANVAVENFSDPRPELTKYEAAMLASSNATAKARAALSRVPEEYRG